MAGPSTAARPLARRRPTTPPFTDTFTAATLNTTNWPNSYGTYSIVSGRLRITPNTSYPQVASGDVFNLNEYPVWVNVPTIAGPGNGSIHTRFFISDSVYVNICSFSFEGSSGSQIIYMQGTTGPTGSAVTYNPTNHQWLRFRISAGNLLWEAAPDDTTWTTLKTLSLTNETWLNTTAARVVLQSYYTGTEPSPGYAEFDNFCV